MKAYSLRRRLIATILLIECALTLTITVATMLNARQEQLRAFDMMLRGRADSLLGAVQDAEDPGDTVRVNPKALDLPEDDLWEVTNFGGQVLAHSTKWIPDDLRNFDDTNRPRIFRDRGHRFRGLTLHGVRQVDADDQSPGVPRPVRIDYAASLLPVHRALWRTERFLIISNTALLLVTGLLVTLLLRRGLAPLEELSRAAAQMTPSNPEFRAPEAACRVAELSVLAKALQSSTQRLKKAFRQQEIFVHDAAHELKTAVTIVKSSLQLLVSRTRTSQEYAEGLRTCLDDCSRMEELVQRMLLLARFEQGAPELDAFDLTEAACEVGAQLETFAKLRGVHLHVEANESAWVPLSEEACASLISCLMLNALQHCPENGRAELSVRAAGDMVTLRVCDTGSGIAPEELPHVFDRFYRGDSSRARSSGGTGLGLAICKAIVDSCGGSIKLESTLGAGTTAEVQLPRAAAMVR
ncbi:MAG: HAMP domain-containing sensor histidine kinase [Acidobacteriaceae bacterium]